MGSMTKELKRLLIRTLSPSQGERMKVRECPLILPRFVLEGVRAVGALMFGTRRRVSLH